MQSRPGDLRALALGSDGESLHTTWEGREPRVGCLKAIEFRFTRDFPNTVKLLLRSTEFKLFDRPASAIPFVIPVRENAGGMTTQSEAWFD